MAARQVYTFTVLVMLLIVASVAAYAHPLGDHEDHSAAAVREHVLKYHNGDDSVVSLFIEHLLPGMWSLRIIESRLIKESGEGLHENCGNGQLCSRPGAAQGSI